MTLLEEERRGEVREVYDVKLSYWNIVVIDSDD